MGFFTDIVQMYKLNKAINSNCSIDRTNQYTDRGYSIEVTPNGDGLAINTGKRVRYIMNQDKPTNWNLGFIKDNEVVS